MGSTFTIQVWGKHFGDEYSYLGVWNGESLLGALIAFVKAKRKGYGCVTLEWR